jgi:hypothetical protein
VYFRLYFALLSLSFEMRNTSHVLMYISSLSPILKYIILHHINVSLANILRDFFKLKSLVIFMFLFGSLIN